MTEDIISALGRFSGVMVISNNAMQAYKGRQLTPAQISRELGVRYIAQGSVRQADGKLRVSVELSDAEKGVQLWSDRFEGSGHQVFDIQDQVVKNIVGHLAVKLTNLEQQRVATKPSGTHEAYDMVLRARALLAKPERSSNREARNLLAQATQLASGYAAAFATLAEAEQQRLTLGWIEDVEDGISRAEAAARRALALADPGAHVRAHGTLSYIHILRGEFELALAESDRALELNGSDAAAHASKGSVLLWLGLFDESIKSSSTALRFDPHLPTGNIYNLAFANYMSGRLKDALVVADRGLSANPGYYNLQVVRAMALAEMNDLVGARAAVEQVRKFSPLFDAGNFGTRFARPEDQNKVQLAIGKAGL